MKLADWARLEGIHPKTAYRWFRTGQMPVPAEKIASGSILVHDPKYNKPAADNGRVVVYARVSSHDQKSSLDGQIARATAAATGMGMPVDEVVAEVGSGGWRSARRCAIARCTPTGQAPGSRRQRTAGGCT